MENSSLIISARNEETRNEEVKKKERVFGIKDLPKEVVVCIISWIPDLSGVQNFGLTSKTYLPLSRCAIVMDRFVLKFFPKIWPALKGNQKEAFFAEWEDLRYLGPVSHRKQFVLGDIAVSGETLVLPYTSRKKEHEGVRVRNYLDNDLSFPLVMGPDKREDLLVCRCSAVSEDFVVRTKGRTIKVWSRQTNDCLHTLHTPEDDCDVKQCHLIGERLVSVSSSSIRVWSLKRGECIWSIPCSTEYSRVIPSATWIVCQTKEEECGVYDLRTGKRRFSFEVSCFSDVCFSERFLLVANPGKIKRFDLATGEEAESLKIEWYGCNKSLAVEGELLVAACTGHFGSKVNILVWNVNTGKQLRSWEVKKQGGRKVQSSLVDGRVYLYPGKMNMEMGTHVKIFDCVTKKLLQDIDMGIPIRQCFVGESSLIVRVDENWKQQFGTKANIFVFSRPSSHRSKMEEQPTKQQLEKKKRVRKIGDLGVLSDPLILRVLSFLEREDVESFGSICRGGLELSQQADYWERSLREKNLDCQSTTNFWARYRILHIYKPWKCVGPIHYSGHRIDESAADDELFINKAYKHVVQVWNHQKGEKLPTLFGHTGSVRALALDERWIVTGGDDHCVKVWNRGSHDLLATLNGHENQIRQCFISSDHIVTTDEKQIFVWKLGQEDPVSKMDHLHYGKVVVLGDRLIVQADHLLKYLIYDLEGNQRCEIKVNGPQGFSRSGNSLYVGSYGDGIREFDLETGQHVRNFSSYEGEYRDGDRVEASALEGNLLVSCLEGGQVKVWNRITGELRQLWQRKDQETKSCQLQEGLLYLTDKESDAVEVWDPLSGTKLQKLSNHSQTQACIEKCDVLAHTVILTLNTSVYQHKLPNVFVWVKESQEHPQLVMKEGLYAEQSPAAERAEQPGDAPGAESPQMRQRNAQPGVRGLPKSRQQRKEPLPLWMAIFCCVAAIFVMMASEQRQRPGRGPR